MFLELEKHGEVFVLRMQLGENRFNRESVRAIHDALDEVERAPGPAALVTTGSGKNRSTRVEHHALHEVRQEIDPRQLNPDSDLGIPIAIRLPEGMATRLHDKPRRYWELDVSADTPGIDYSARFLVPVYGDEPRFG